MKHPNYNDYTDAPYRIYRPNSERTYNRNTLLRIGTDAKQGFKVVKKVFAIESKRVEIPTYRRPTRPYVTRYYFSDWDMCYFERGRTVSMKEVKDTIIDWYNEDCERIDKIWTFVALDWHYYLGYFCKRHRKRVKQLPDEYFNLVVQIANRIEVDESEFLGAPNLLAMDVIREHRLKRFPVRVRKMLRGKGGL